MAAVVDRNQPRVKLEGFELAPAAPVKPAAPTPQDILARFSNTHRDSNDSIRSANQSSTPNNDVVTDPFSTTSPFGGSSASLPVSSRATAAGQNVGNGQNAFSISATFGSFQPFRHPFGSSAHSSTFDADLFALTGGVGDGDLAAAGGGGGGGAAGGGVQYEHSQRHHQQHSQQTQQSAPENNWEESALAIGMISSDAAQIKFRQMSNQPPPSNQHPSHSFASPFGAANGSPQIMGGSSAGATSGFGFHPASAPNPAIHDDQSSFLDHLYDSVKGNGDVVAKDIGGGYINRGNTVPYMFQGHQQQQQHQRHGSMHAVPGSPIWTQGHSTQSGVSMMTASSASQSNMPTSFHGGHGGHGGGAIGRASEDVDASWRTPQEEQTAFVDSPLMEGAPPRKMSRSNVEDVTSFRTQPTWPARRASFAENGVGAAWTGGNSRAPGGFDPRSEALRRSSTGQASMVRPAFNSAGSGGSVGVDSMHDVGISSPRSSNTGSGGFNRYLMPSRQSQPSSRSPNGTDISPPRRLMDQVDEEGMMVTEDDVGNALTMDDPSPMSGQRRESVAKRGSLSVTRDWRRAQKGNGTVEDMGVGDEEAEEGDSPTDLQQIAASDNAEARRSRRRLSHNEVERRRREVINEKIQELETLLPAPMIANAIAVRDAEGGGDGDDEDGTVTTGKKGKSGKKKGKKTAMPEKLCKGTVLCLTVELVKQLSAIIDASSSREQELQQTIQQLRLQVASGSNSGMAYVPDQSLGGLNFGGHHMSGSPYAASMEQHEALRSLDELANGRTSYHQPGENRRGSGARSQSRGRKRSSSQMQTVEEVAAAEAVPGYYGPY